MCKNVSFWSLLFCRICLATSSTSVSEHWFQILCRRHICCAVLCCTSPCAFIRSPVSPVFCLHCISTLTGHRQQHKYEQEYWTPTNNSISSARWEVPATSHPRSVITCFILQTHRSTVHVDLFDIWLLSCRGCDSAFHWDWITLSPSLRLLGRANQTLLSAQFEWITVRGKAE